MEKGKVWQPMKLKLLNRSSINVAQLIMSQIFVPLLNLVNITLAGASRTRNIKETKAFIIGIIANSR